MLILDVQSFINIIIYKSLTYSNIFNIMIFFQSPDLIFSATERHRLTTVATGKIELQVEHGSYIRW